MVLVVKLPTGFGFNFDGKVIFFYSYKNKDNSMIAILLKGQTKIYKITK